MSLTQDSVSQRAAYWPVPVARAIPALILGLYITFSADHSARLGLVLFGAFAVASGVPVVLLSRRLTDRVARGIFVALGTIAAVCGIAALALNGVGLGLLLFLLTVFAALTGFLELYAGLRARGRFVASRDWLLVGAFTAFTALVFLLIPPDAVVAVGLLGAYGVTVGVYLLIGGLSLKWGTQERSAAKQPAGSER